MQGSRWFLVFSVVLAFLTRDLAFWLVGFEYELLGEPFNLIKFAVDLGSLVALVYAYTAILGMFSKSRDGKVAARAPNSDS